MEQRRSLDFDSNTTISHLSKTFSLATRFPTSLIRLHCAHAFTWRAQKRGAVRRHGAMNSAAQRGTRRFSSRGRFSI